MISDFSERVLAWFDEHGRTDLPWQIDPTPYRVWVSEIMLQQTRVATVIEYYTRFMRRFPDVRTLADAPVDEVLHYWSGLGYYARARNLHQAAIRVRDHYACTFPDSLDEVMSLPGIGRSTAGAMLALSMGQRQPILDGNVKRVLARVHAVAGWPGRTSVARELWALAEHYTPQQRVAAYTQAMMDLGATLCTRTNPACERCPLMEDCAARAQGAPQDYPHPKPKKTLPVRRTLMLLLRDENDCVYLRRRPPAGIWGGLWGFPEFDDAEAVQAWCERRLGLRIEPHSAWPELRHTFSHFHLDITPIPARMLERSGALALEPAEEVWYNTRSPKPLGLAAPVQKLLARLARES